MDGLMVPLTTTTFDQEVAGSHLPVLVDFWAQGCGPCATIAPVLEEIAAEHTGRLRVAGVRLDDAPELAARFEIMALPARIIFAGGRPVKRITAVGGKSQLLADLKEFLLPTGTPA
jgi:thioredoxin 1